MKLGTFTNTNGRLNRKTFILNFWCLTVGSSLITLLVAKVAELRGYNIYLPIFILTVLALLYPCSILIKKRFHDLNMGGGYVVLAFIPWINLYFFYYLCLFKRGTNGPNQYGPNPLAVNESIILDRNLRLS